MVGRISGRYARGDVRARQASAIAPAQFSAPPDDGRRIVVALDRARVERQEQRRRAQPRAGSGCVSSTPASSTGR